MPTQLLDRAQTLPSEFVLKGEVSSALHKKTPIVALESTVITHGLPHPENLTLARNMENEIRKIGGIPATIAVINGKIHVGLSDQQLQELSTITHSYKISVRDFAPVLVKKGTGGTTVAGTLYAAHKAGIRVFATGGIGGVHREPAVDISADLPQLASTPVIVVCAGAKAILNLPDTLEYLETAGVPVIGYQTDEFPAFYSRQSGLPVSARADSPEDVVAIATTHWGLGMRSAILVTAPPPVEIALPVEQLEEAINQALTEARQQAIRGQSVTPFLLARVSELTGKASLQANLGLLLNNANLAAQIAQVFYPSRDQNI